MGKPKIRFKGYEDDWEQRKLKDYLEVSREKNKTESYGKEDVLSVSGEHGIVNQIEFQGRSFAGVSVANYGVVEAGDVVYTKSPLKSNPYGIIKTNKGKTGIVSTLYAVYKPRMNTNSEFVQIYFELDSRMNSYMHPLVNKGAKNDMKVSDENALKGPVAFPELEEQNAITQYFDKLDRLITLHQRKCEETKSLKKYMLQKMFPENGNCVPKIRFSGFADAWEQRKWIDVVDISTEMVNPTTGEYDNMPHIAPGNIESFTGRILDNVKTVKEEQLISGKFRFRPDDVVYGKINPQLGKYFYATVNGLTSADAYVFNGKNGLKQKFLFALLQTSDFFKYSVSVSKRSGMPKINRDELNAYSFLMPSEEEQDRIGSYLLQLDHLITLHQRKCEETKSLKKYMLQKMFPENGNCVPKIRFSGFADAWEQRKWIDVVDISTEMVNPTTGEYDNMPHIAPGNIESFTGRILDNVKTVKEEQLISGKFRFRPDDVVYGKINPQLGKYFYATVNGLTSADAYVFNGKNGLKQKFLFALLQTSDFFKYSVSVSKRSGMPKINRDELNAYSFLMPSEEEQDRIGSYLLQLDHLITLHQHKCDELQKLKKFMLQNMFV